MIKSKKVGIYKRAYSGKWTWAGVVTGKGFTSNSRTGSRSTFVSSTQGLAWSIVGDTK